MSGDKIRNPHIGPPERGMSHLMRGAAAVSVFRVNAVSRSSDAQTHSYICVVCGRLFWSPSEILSVELRGTVRAAR